MGLFHGNKWTKIKFIIMVWKKVIPNKLKDISKRIVQKNKIEFGY